jgi:hypothetical protein
MTKAGVERVEGTMLVTVKADGTFTNVRVKSLNPSNLRNAVSRTFNGTFSDSGCKTAASPNDSDIEFDFSFKLE